MVRFIIDAEDEQNQVIVKFTFQYGQIYYDEIKPYWTSSPNHLHSNMVRFIIEAVNSSGPGNREFTFQYGQIYYTSYLKTQPRFNQNLHSNMVRFIMIIKSLLIINFVLFTFQYGQIYYPLRTAYGGRPQLIYIPIWLDLLYILKNWLDKNVYDLHSNMVRFIIIQRCRIYCLYP